MLNPRLGKMGMNNGRNLGTDWNNKRFGLTAFAAFLPYLR
jgi:hypothetical protein